MNDAISVVLYIFNKFIDILFNRIEILPGVFLGWVFISCIIISILFNSILNIPTGLISSALNRKEKTENERGNSN